jgi:hypothetical protein
MQILTAVLSLSATLHLDLDPLHRQRLRLPTVRLLVPINGHCRDGRERHNDTPEVRGEVQ